MSLEKRAARVRNARQAVKLFEEGITGELVEVFLERCDEVVFVDPGEAVELARVGMLAAERVSERLVGSAWAVLGSALRAKGSYSSAEDAYREALLRARAPQDRMDALQRRARLFADMGQLDKALADAEAAVAGRRQVSSVIREAHSLACALVLRGYVHHQRGAAAEAAADFGEALTVSHPVGWPRTYLAALHNLLTIQEEAMLSVEEISAAMGVVRRELQKLAYHFVFPRFKLTWIYARLHARIGSTRMAEKLLRKAAPRGIRFHGEDFVACMLDLVELIEMNGDRKDSREVLAKILAAGSAWRDKERVQRATAAIEAAFLGEKSSSVGELLTEVRAILGQPTGVMREPASSSLC